MSVDFEKIENFSESTENLAEPVVYNLKWAVRDEILANFNEYTQLLCGKKLDQLDISAKNSLVRSNIDLYEQLINLPVLGDEEIFDEAKPEQRIEVSLDLEVDLREEILDALVANQKLITNSGTTSKEVRRKMIKKNDSLVAKLIQLPVTVIDDEVEEEDEALDEALDAQSSDEVQDDPKPKAERSQLAYQVPRRLNRPNDDKTVELFKMISILNKENENKIAELTEKVSTLSKTNAEKEGKITDQASKISTLNADLSRLKSKKIDLGELVKQMHGKADIGLNREKIDFEFSIGSVYSFRLGQTLKSRVHFCKNLAWSVEAYKKTVDRKEYLSVFLSATNLAGDKVEWLADMNFKITLMTANQAVDSCGGMVQFTNLSSTWGLEKFIPIERLQGGCWKIRVHLEPSKVDETWKWLGISLGLAIIGVSLILVGCSLMSK